MGGAWHGHGMASVNWHGHGMASVTWHGHGMASVNHTRPHSLSDGKDTF